ncbi:MAG: hypothetical protein LBP19_08700 [Treponema sp.]|nr:hypothetical protein [Treponema sp.]
MAGMAYGGIGNRNRGGASALDAAGGAARGSSPPLVHTGTLRLKHTRRERHG